MSSAELAALGEEFFRRSMEASPFKASMCGLPGYDGVLPDISRDVELEQAAAVAAVRDRALALREGQLVETDRITRDALLHQCESFVTSTAAAWHDFTVSGMSAPHHLVINGISKAVLTSPAAAGDYLSRCRAADRLLDQAAARLRAGLAVGRVPNARSVVQGLGEIDAYLAAPRAEDPLLKPAPPVGIDGDRWRGAVEEVVTRRIRPALQRLRAVIAEDISPLARPDDRCGVLHVPGGAEAYAAALAEHTTTALPAEEIHQTGLDLLAALSDEMRDAGRRLFGTNDVGEVIDRLRGDLSLRYASAEDIVADARAALARAEQALPDWFNRWHRTACTVEEMSPFEAENAVLGYYHAPTADGSRPGRHWINTFRPESRMRYEYEALAFHESVPGHHLQFALGQRLALPDFRRFGCITAFGEGWALYAERLADEMGLYSGDLPRFGMLSFDSWRAARLVVDTGLHVLGWSRDRAIDFMWRNTALSMANIRNEVDRYIAWPGQACAYMIGRLEIQRLRDVSTQRLASRFDIRAFHDAVLSNGMLPLTVLDNAVEQWLTESA